MIFIYWKTQCSVSEYHWRSPLIFTQHKNPKLQLAFTFFRLRLFSFVDLQKQAQNGSSNFKLTSNMSGNIWRLIKPTLKKKTFSLVRHFGLNWKDDGCRYGTPELSRSRNDDVTIISQMLNLGTPEWHPKWRVSGSKNDVSNELCRETKMTSRMTYPVTPNGVPKKRI